MVFPTPLTPTNIHTFGSPSVAARWRSPVASSKATSSSRSASHERLGVADPLVAGPLPQAVEQPFRGRHADVGEQQRLLELLPRRVVDRAPASDRGERAQEHAAGAPEPVAQLGRRRQLVDDRLGHFLFDDRLLDDRLLDDRLGLGLEDDRWRRHVDRGRGRVGGRSLFRRRAALRPPREDDPGRGEHDRQEEDDGEDGSGIHQALPVVRGPVGKGLRC